MRATAPTRSRVYRNHHLDSTRWDPYRPRAGDIVISTSIKSGTTWTQSIVRQLIVHAMQQAGVEDPAHFPAPDNGSSLWPDARWGAPLDELYTRMEAQQHRRFLKTHLALDGLPFYPQVKYLVVGRDPRDVFMSLWNHYAAYTDYFYALLNDDPARPGDPCPCCPANIHDFWALWIARGWFDWEQEGYPFWGNLHHNQSWWDHRGLDNILFLHYADMLAGPAGEIRRIAQFLDIEIEDQEIAGVVAHTSLAVMRGRAATAGETRDRPETFRGGANTFFYQGVNGRWRAVLNAAELALYEQTRDRVLSPDCARWLEEGGRGWDASHAAAF
jgi:aryl sulfotransferase